MSFSKQDEQNFLNAQPLLRRICLSLTRNKNDADDLSQTVLLKAWAAQDQFEGGTNMHGWLGTIARNEFFSLGRRKKRVVLTPDGDIALMGDIGGEVTHPAAEDALRLQEVFNHMAQLPPAQVETLIFAAAGDEYEDIAVKQSVPVGTVKSRISRARAALMEARETGKVRQSTPSAFPSTRRRKASAPALEEPVVIEPPPPPKPVLPAGYLDREATAQAMNIAVERVEKLFENFARQIDRKGYATMGKPWPIAFKRVPQADETSVACVPEG